MHPPMGADWPNIWRHDHSYKAGQVTMPIEPAHVCTEESIEAINLALIRSIDKIGQIRLEVAQLGRIAPGPSLSGKVK